MHETTKAFLRRSLDPFWRDVFTGDGLDIGSGDDPFQEDWIPAVDSIRHFDLEDGDAQVLTRYVQPCTYDFVHSSNCLEHMRNPYAALLEWYAVLKPGGYLVLTVPDEDLYEQGVFPSKWNQDHKWTFTFWKEGSWSKQSINIPELVSVLHNAQVRRLHLCDDRYDYSLKGVDQTYEGTAEAFIEVVIRKMPLEEIEGATFKHSGARGDLVYGLPAMKALGGGKLLINIDKTRYLGKALDSEGVEQFRELLEGEDYIEAVEVWDGSVPTYDLDDFREVEVDANLLSMGHLTKFGVWEDLSKPWLKVKPKHVADIVVNRTWRYHGPFAWDELSEWLDRCVFVGSVDEYEDFMESTALETPRYETKTYLELARVIAGSKLFVGNQSFPYALSEALKVPRILEVCPVCPNCNPIGSNGFTSLTQDILRHYLKGEELKGEYVNKSHLPWKLAPIKQMSDVRLGRMKQKPKISCVIPFQEGHEMALKRFTVKAEADGAQVIVGCGSGNFEQRANQAAEDATGDVICVVDISMCDDYGTAVVLAAEFKIAMLGMIGMYMSTDSYPHPSGPCIAVSKRAYEECGLFNPAMESGRLNVMELCLRYAKRRYACKTAGLGKWMCRQDRDEKNVEYLKMVYEVKV
jgi:SAM-dependent methyltransferase